MGSELLSQREKVEGGSEESELPSFLSEIFEECFPYYLSIGMSYDEYWNGDPGLVKAYRKAETIRTQRKNSEMWLQGRYVYEAIVRASPILNDFKPREPMDYVDEPFPITKEDYRKMVERRERERRDNIRNKLMAFAKQRKEMNKGGNEDE